MLPPVQLYVVCQVIVVPLVAVTWEVCEPDHTCDIRNKEKLCTILEIAYHLLLPTRPKDYFPMYTP